jgi:hypothetical protein
MKRPDKIAELGAALIVGAVLIIATVLLSVAGVQDADDKPLNGEEPSSSTSNTTTVSSSVPPSTS